MMRRVLARTASVGVFVRRRPLRSALLVVAILVAVVGLMAILDLLFVYRSLSAARAELVELEVTDLAGAGGDIEALAATAADRLASADDRAESSLSLSLLSHLPVASSQVNGLRDITSALDEIGKEAREAGHAIQQRFDDLDSDASARVDLLDEVIDQLQDLDAAVNTTDLGGRSLPGPLGSVRSALGRQLDEAVDKLADASASVSAVRDLLAGPSRYLLLAGNNSEMRGTPMPLAAGILEFDYGEVTTTELVQTDLLHLGANRVALPDDLTALYGDRWGLGREWRTSTTTPRFPVAAALLAEMSSRSPLGAVDGVLLVDAVTLGAMVDAVGGIEVEGELRSGADLVEQVLNTSYRLEKELGRRARFYQQGELAQEAFDQLTKASDSLLDLAAQMPELAGGRHLLAWSSDPAIQQVWTDIGADGELNEYSFMVAHQNASGSKRDWYLDPTVTISSGISLSGSSVHVFARARLENPIIDTEVEVIQGSSQFIEPGEHRSWVTIYLPEAADDIQVYGGIRVVAEGRDGPSRVVTGWQRVKEGHAREFTVEFTLPADEAVALLVPSARVRPMGYTVNGVELTDDQPQVLVLNTQLSSSDAAGRTRWATVAGAGILLNAAFGWWQVRRRFSRTAPAGG